MALFFIGDGEATGGGGGGVGPRRRRSGNPRSMKVEWAVVAVQ
jgi:hypothetical protein